MSRGRKKENGDKHLETVVSRAIFTIYGQLKRGSRSEYQAHRPGISGDQFTFRVETSPDSVKTPPKGEVRQSVGATHATRIDGQCIYVAILTRAPSRNREHNF